VRPFRQGTICFRLRHMRRHLQQLSRAVVLACCLVSPLLLVAPTAAQEEDRARQELQELEERLESERRRAADLAAEAESLRRSLEELRRESTETAARVQQLEAAISAGELAVAVFSTTELRMAEALRRERLRLADSLAALQRLRLLPPEAALTTRGHPLDALRAAHLLSGAVPALTDRAQRYSALYDRYVVARAGAEQERKALTAQARELEAEQQRLAELTARRQEVLGGTTTAQEAAEERATTTAREAESLRQLIEQLEAEAERERQRRAEEARLAAEAAARARALREAARQEAEEARADAQRQAQAEAAAAAASAAEAEAAERQQAVRRSEPPEGARSLPAEPAALLVLPAQGRIAAGFGDTHGETITSQGLVIETRAGAQVVAPFDGRVAYAGEFRRYGLILIIEHDGRYHSLLAGLGRLTAAKGQWVMAGEPVGSMSAEGSRGKELYLELRRGGQPVDPLPWLADSGTKARG
jgi:septal ring factor EnvC (AmiA/AmiB activator)